MVVRHKHELTFTLHVGNRQSIGPAELQSMWQEAAQSSDVSVSRRTSAYDQAKQPYYELWAWRLHDKDAVERRLRSLLESKGYLFGLADMTL